MPRGARWSFAALVANDAFSWMALAFVSVSSVLPALAGQLTDKGALIGLTGPLFALSAHASGLGWLARGYAAVFVTLGVFTSAIWLGFLNALLARVMGGWLLEATSYPVLFGTTAALTALGPGLAVRLGMA